MADTNNPCCTLPNVFHQTSSPPESSDNSMLKTKEVAPISKPYKKPPNMGVTKTRAKPNKFNSSMWDAEHVDVVWARNFMVMVFCVNVSCRKFMICLECMVLCFISLCVDAPVSTAGNDDYDNISKMFRKNFRK
jgi:hypothetical protein